MDVARLVIEILTLIAIAFAVLQLVGDRNQRHREFENLYVQRYWNLVDRMSDDLYLKSNEELRRPSSDSRLMVAYLRLCEDQIDVRKEGFVTDRTWKIWGGGIRTQLEEAAYKRQFKENESDLPSLTAFLQDQQDPLRWTCLKKWWHGLR